MAIEPLVISDSRPFFITTKVNELVEQSNRQDAAIEQLCYWLVGAGTGFNAHDSENIIKILRGESLTENANLGEAKGE